MAVAPLPHVIVQRPILFSLEHVVVEENRPKFIVNELQKLLAVASSSPSRKS